nr:translation initiation factor IF-2-like [Taeniopygia guttata]
MKLNIHFPTEQEGWQSQDRVIWHGRLCYSREQIHSRAAGRDAGLDSCRPLELRSLQAAPGRRGAKSSCGCDRDRASKPAIPPQTGDSASNRRFRLETGDSASPRSARAPLREEGTAAAPRPPRHWPRPPSLTLPAGPRQPGTPDGAGAARPRSHRGDRHARLSRPAARSPPPARSAPGRPCRPRERNRGCRSARAPRVPARCPVPGAGPVPSPAAASAGSASAARPAQPLCVRARGCKWRPPGTRQRRHRAAPGGSERLRAAPGGTGRPEAPAAAAEPRALLAAGLAAGPVPPQSQRPARPTGVREPPLTGGVLRAAAAEPGGAGGGCGIPGSASGLAVPAGDAPLLPQPRALRARTGEKQKRPPKEM